jgi:hypothetical protein
VMPISAKACPRRKVSSLSRTVHQPQNKNKTTALALAMSRDGSSGGVIRMMVLTGDRGPERLFFSEPNIPKFWEKE